MYCARVVWKVVPTTLSRTRTFSAPRVGLPRERLDRDAASSDLRTRQAKLFTCPFARLPRLHGHMRRVRARAWRQMHEQNIRRHAMAQNCENCAKFAADANVAPAIAAADARPPGLGVLPALRACDERRTAERRVAGYCMVVLSLRTSCGHF